MLNEFESRWVLFLVCALLLLTTVAAGQTYQESNGPLTYTMQVSSSSSCPVGSPGGPQQPVISYAYYNFAYSGHSLNGGTAYLSSPGGSYCPPTGPTGANPLQMDDSTDGYILFFYPCA